MAMFRTPDLSEEEKEEVWAALLKRVDEIDRASKQAREFGGSARTAGAILCGVKGMSVNFRIWQSDGRSKMHLLRAYYSTLRRDEGKVRIEEEVYWSDNDDFWQPRYEDFQNDPGQYLIVNHKFYSLGTGNGGGFGGRNIRFKRLEEDERYGLLRGKEEVTHDLWYGGVIPPAWRDRLPDNAVFLDGFDGPTVMY